MANKNHELDKPIIEAAKIEFLKNGFQSTSINSIAKEQELQPELYIQDIKGKMSFYIA